MKIKVNLSKIFKVFGAAVMLIGIYILLSTFVMKELTISAYDTTCPDYMTAEECLEYLQEQAEKIEEEQNQLDSSIESENTEQMSLYQQIDYLSNQIKETELDIAEKELDIERKNVEIRLLGEDIIEIQNNIDTIVQEINKLEEIIDDRTAESYKLTFISPLEILLDSKNFETMMRRTKYLVETKKKDKELMSDMAVSKKSLEEEEKILNEKKEAVQEKRNAVEAQMAKLAEDKKNLEAQKAQQNSLLAESERREREMAAQLRENISAQEEIDSAIAQKIQEMWDNNELGEGTAISAGTVIGKMGNSGCSTGAHLHIAIDDGTARLCNGNINPWNGYFRKKTESDPYLIWAGFYMWYIEATNVHIPLSGSPYLTQDFHQGTAIDLSVANGNAFVYSIKGGTYWSGVDSCGGKFAVIEHSDGTRSCYLHLQ
jgi:peptidoglycan hydrolase CwlO-like protein